MSTIDPRRKRDRIPGRSGRPQRIVSTHLPTDDDRKLRALARHRQTSVFAILREAALAYLAGVNFDDYSRDTRTLDAFGGLSPRREPTTRGDDGLPLPRLRERDAAERRKADGPPTGRDLPSNIR
jgi:hypothetical protein